MSISTNYTILRTMFLLSLKVFSKDKIEKNIGKKIYPLIKYKFVDRTYKTNSFELESISKIYGILLKQMKLNFKNEVIIVQSDLPFNYILPSGTMFMSDVINLNLRRVFFISLKTLMLLSFWSLIWFSISRIDILVKT